jgi:hypothetical protein
MHRQYVSLFLDLKRSRIKRLPRGKKTKNKACGVCGTIAICMISLPFGAPYSVHKTALAMPYPLSRSYFGIAGLITCTAQISAISPISKLGYIQYKTGMLLLYSYSFSQAFAKALLLWPFQNGWVIIEFPPLFYCGRQSVYYWLSTRLYPDSIRTLNQ